MPGPIYLPSAFLPIVQVLWSLLEAVFDLPLRRKFSILDTDTLGWS